LNSRKRSHESGVKPGPMAPDSSRAQAFLLKRYRQQLRQFRSFLPALLVSYILTFLLIGSITLFALSRGKRIWYFTYDPFILGHLPFYAGLLSNLAILLWGAGATICFFISGFLPKDTLLHSFRRFFFISGLLTSLFLFDDLFQFHRILYYKYLHLSSGIVFIVYGLLTLGYLIHFRKEVAGTDYLMMGVALWLFAAAVFIDFFSILPRGSTAFSDGLKFFGIVSWVAYYTRTGYQVLRETGCP
jgi:hypothetical protein